MSLTAVLKLVIRILPVCLALFTTGILVPPTSLTIGVGSVTIFFCNATGRLFDWFVDDVLASDEMIRARGISYETQEMDNYVVGILTIPATTRNNNTVIYCSVAGTNGIVDSPVATLTVQGDLDTDQ